MSGPPGPPATQHTTLVMGTAASHAGSGTTTTTVLSSAQATQLLQRLQNSQGGGAGGGGAIKIQAVQTNPQTGVRQIIAIPIQTSSHHHATHAGGEMRARKASSSTLWLRAARLSCPPAG
eukprot:snap_masked-scaffold276_size226481-processed-gene-1.5 protein:Tk04707 transcript:snap_masked-scaffold276_size226481-processed-gene-1.5-mRNA-1 annotation:"methyl-accepting chemotaxis sensory transducer"